MEQPLNFNFQVAYTLILTPNSQHSSNNTNGDNKRNRYDSNNQIPFCLSLPNQICQISCGYNFSVLLDRKGKIYSVGNCQKSQVSYQNNTKLPNLTQISLPMSAPPDRICCGYFHSIVYNKNEVYGWGDHSNGALGYESYQIRDEYKVRKLPILIENNEEIINVWCGNGVSILNVSDRFYGLGGNWRKQLGGLIRGRQVGELQILEIVGGKKIKDVGVGDGWVVVVGEDERLYGGGDVGKLGFSVGGSKEYTLKGFCELCLKSSRPAVHVWNINSLKAGGNNLVIQFKDGQIVSYGQKTSKTINHSLKNHQTFHLKHVNSQKVILEATGGLYVWGIQQIGKGSLQKLENVTVCGLQQNGWMVGVTRKQARREKGGVSSRLKGNDDEDQLSFNYSHRSNIQSLSYSRLGNSKVSADLQLPYVSNIPQCFEEHNQFERQAWRLGNGKKRQMMAYVGNSELQRQVSEQKQIIRLYEMMVQKLQRQNMQLKTELSGFKKERSEFGTMEQDQYDQYDRLDDGIEELKVKLKAIIQTHFD